MTNSMRVWFRETCSTVSYVKPVFQGWLDKSMYNEGHESQPGTIQRHTGDEGTGPARRHSGLYRIFNVSPCGIIG